MVNKAKIKGSNFERQIAEELTNLVDGSTWKRIAGSGAIGTTMDEPLLKGDVAGVVANYPMKFKGECKAGYNASPGKEVKQITLKKEWLDKITAEARQVYSTFPVFFGKFDNVHSGVKHFVVLDVSVFADMINMYTELKEEFDETYNELQELKNGQHLGTS